MKIGIILGSIREGRVNEDVAKWVKNVAENYSQELEFELVDLKTFDLPVFAEPASPAYTDDLVEKEKQRPWSEKMNSLDGYIFITPEYNHGMSSALKNGLDFVYHELNDKAAGIVSYGSAGGVRSAEQLRTVLSEFQVAHVRTHPALSLFYDWDDEGLNPSGAQKKAVETMLYQLTYWAEAMKSVREKKAEKAGDPKK
ncbi:NAD(P)H-dependent FMN reductase [Alkalibacterium subtropicum]|uniref:NAD(P)H-dependent FMN reductase n=1 Tax=Alkalibacterium subtropicum TaxID=753702 RepID=A0A1I1KBA2_9LACT|nr:NAD(P)H-dependent oxidoreductase [Alkalibacterium subtropicum]SFC55978.1 NAD(P)H-dependent FMN reductase [Alkalibacterium subtropicum]